MMCDHWSLGILHLSKRFFRSDSVIFPPSWPVWAIWHNIASTWNRKVKLGLYWFGIACCPFSGLVSLIVFNLALASWSSTCTICARISIRAWLSWKTPGSGFRSSYSPSAPSSPAVASACHPHLPWRKYSKRSQHYWTPEWQSWPALIMWNSQEHTVHCPLFNEHCPWLKWSMTQQNMENNGRLHCCGDFTLWEQGSKTLETLANPAPPIPSWNYSL